MKQLSPLAYELLVDINKSGSVELTCGAVIYETGYNTYYAIWEFSDGQDYKIQLDETECLDELLENLYEQIEYYS